MKYQTHPSAYSIAEISERGDKKINKKVRLSPASAGREGRGLFDRSQSSSITGVLALKVLKTKIGSWPVPQRLLNLTELRGRGDESPQMNAISKQQRRCLAAIKANSYIINVSCKRHKVQVHLSSRTTNGAAVAAPPLRYFFQGYFGLCDLQRRHLWTGAMDGGTLARSQWADFRGKEKPLSEVRTLISIKV